MELRDVCSQCFFQLKPGREALFCRLLDTDIIPMLQTQTGFQDEITFVAPGGVDVVGISMWHLEEDADKYAQTAYPGVLKALEPVVEGTPQVTTYEVSNSTVHQLAARAIVQADRRRDPGFSGQAALASAFQTRRDEREKSVINLSMLSKSRVSSPLARCLRGVCGVPIASGDCDGGVAVRRGCGASAGHARSVEQTFTNGRRGAVSR